MDVEIDEDKLSRNSDLSTYINMIKDEDGDLLPEFESARLIDYPNNISILSVPNHMGWDNDLTIKTSIPIFKVYYHEVEVMRYNFTLNKMYIDAVIINTKFIMNILDMIEPELLPDYSISPVEYEDYGDRPFTVC